MGLSLIPEGRRSLVLTFWLLFAAGSVSSFSAPPASTSKNSQCQRGNNLLWMGAFQERDISGPSKRGQDQQPKVENRAVRLLAPTQSGTSTRGKVQRGRRSSSSPARYKTQKPSREFQLMTEQMQRLRSSEEITNWLRQQTTRRKKDQCMPPHDQPAFIRELAKRKAYDAIPLFVRELSDGSVFVYTTAISEMARASNSVGNVPTTTPLDLLDEMDNLGVHPTEYTFTAVLKSIDGGSGVVQFLERIRNQYRVTNMGVEVFNAAIHACSRGPNKDDWQTALQLFLRLKKEGVKPDQTTFSSLIRCCARAGQLRVSLALLSEMRQSIVPNERVWSTVLHACAQVGDHRESVKVLKEMQDAGISPTKFHITSLFSALSKSRQHDLSIQLMESMQLGRSTTLRLGGASEVLTLEPIAFDLVALNSVLNSVGKDGNWELAKALFERLKEGEFLLESDDGVVVAVQPDIVSYNAVLAACRDPKEARSIVREMRYSRRHRHGATPPNSVTYTHAITACRRSNPPDLDTALEFLQWADDDNLHLHEYTYSAAIWTAETCGDSDVAMNILNQMREAGCKPNVASFLGVMSSLSAEGRAEEAVSVLWEMKTVGTKPNADIYAELAYAIQKAPEGVDGVALLRSVVDQMEDQELRARIGGPIFEDLILEYGMRGKFTEALAVFGTIDGPSDGACLRAILVACTVAQPPRWEEALQILHTSDVVDDARGPGVMDMKAIGLAMNACSKANQPLEALTLLQLYGRKPSEYERMLATGSPGSDVCSTVPVAAINSLISSCGRYGRPDLSLRILNTMKKSLGVSPDATTYRSAAIACNQAEHERLRRESQRRQPRHTREEIGITPQWWECSLSLLRRMREEGLHPDVQIYSSVISSCQAAGEWQRALGVFKDVVASCDGDMSRLNLYCVNAAISACEKGSAWVEALDIFHQMPETGPLRPDRVTINTMVEALIRAEQPDLALDTYKRGLRLRSVRPWRNTTLETGERVRALDLHHNSAAMASVAVRCVMEAVLEGDRKVHDTNKDLVIIVGKGKHSDDNIPVLGPLVRTLLMEQFGSDSVTTLNNGRVVVECSVLKKFVAMNRYTDYYNEDLLDEMD